MNLKPILAAGIIAATPFAASAATVIDDFSLGQGPVIDDTVGGTVPSDTIPNDGNYDWDSRQLRANLISSELSCGEINCPKVETAIDGGNFIYDSDTGTESWVELRYHYTDYNLLGEGENAFAFDFDGVGSDQEFRIRVRVTDGDGVGSYRTFEGPFIGGGGEFTILFSSLLDGEDDPNLTDISRIDFRFSTQGTATEALDLRISTISAAVPLPAGVLLMGTALAGFGVMRRRQKKAAA